MKFSWILVAACLFLPSVGAQAAICLNTDQIQNSDTPDGKTLVLKMKDGKVWHTTLEPACPDIRINGFSWNTQGGRVCENAQILRVIRSGAICGIGKFVSGLPDKPK